MQALWIHAMFRIISIIYSLSADWEWEQCGSADETDILLHVRDLWWVQDCSGAGHSLAVPQVPSQAWSHDDLPVLHAPRWGQSGQLNSLRFYYWLRTGVGSCRVASSTRRPLWTPSFPSWRRTPRLRKWGWLTSASSSRTVSTLFWPHASCTSWAKRDHAPLSQPSTSASSTTGSSWRTLLSELVGVAPLQPHPLAPSSFVLLFVFSHGSCCQCSGKIWSSLWRTPPQHHGSTPKSTTGHWRWSQGPSHLLFEHSGPAPEGSQFCLHPQQ